nr:hypothetical protein [Streptomyces microflavus]
MIGSPKAARLAKRAAFGLFLSHCRVPRGLSARARVSRSGCSGCSGAGCARRGRTAAGRGERRGRSGRIVRPRKSGRRARRGRVSRSDRTAKYKQLVLIEEELGDNARYAGVSALSRQPPRSGLSRLPHSGGSSFPPPHDHCHGRDKPNDLPWPERTHCRRSPEKAARRPRSSSGASVLGRLPVSPGRIIAHSSQGSSELGEI